MTVEATLSHEAARAVYDRIGSWQDAQAFYEDAATGDLIAHSDFARAERVFEFGSGTGRMAERLLREQLPPTAYYSGLDISTTMVKLARERLAPWRDRAVVQQSDGTPRIPAPDGTFDRFLSTYVLDLLSSDDIGTILGEAYRALVVDGLLCLVSAASGRTPLERFVMGIASRVHAVSPSLVGGCRAIELQRFVTPDRWRVVHRNVISKWGIVSEVLVAKRGPSST